MENNISLLNDLNNSDPAIQNAAIEHIKEEGNLSIVPDLLNMAVQHKDNLAVIRLLTDIKDSAFKTIWIDYIKNNPSPEARAILLRIGWESALDFSEYALFFAKLLIEGPFMVALEAGTILENLSHIDENTKKKIIQLLQANKKDEQTAFLIENVLEYLNTQEE